MYKYCFTRHVLLCLILIIRSTGFATSQISAEATALNSAFLLLRDPCSVFFSPFAASDLDKVTISLSHGNRYNVKGLSSGVVAVALPIPGSVILVPGFSRFGGASYSEDQMAMSLGRTFGSDWFGAVSLNYEQTRIGSTESSKGTLNADAAIRFKAGDEIEIGFQAKGIFARKKHPMITRSAPVVSMGVVYHPTKVHVSCSIEKSPEFRPSFTTAVRYHLAEKLIVLSGFSTTPAQAGFGFGITIRKWEVICAGSVHNVLGISRNISINLII